MIDRLTIEKIMDAAQIVDVVGDFVTLRRAGANYKGLCPFHDDRTPSFMVSPSKNYCKCFACGKGGNPVGFIMEHEQISYPEALRWLARKYGITIQEKELTQEQKAAQTDRESMYIVNNWAKEWFIDQLHNTDDGRAIGMAYFRSRGFRDDIIQKFQLGFCPNKKESPMSADAIKAGYKEKYLVNDPDSGIGTGLSFKNAERGTLRDRFFGRVMWPIFTIGGKVAGFGGRVLDAATKGVAIKYQNSPDSIIYSKRRELFGLYHAKQAISKHDLCYLVEGYTDVMAMHQSGVENVVASSGTALTDGQILLIKRFTSNITVIYDGDEAGIKASKRGIDMLLAQGFNVKLLLLPDGDDPDSFARKHNAEEFQKYLTDNQVDFIKFKTRLVIKDAQDDPSKMAKMVNDIVATISVIPDEITRSFYIREIANMMKLSERMIETAVQKQIKENRGQKNNTSGTKAPAPTPTDEPKPTDVVGGLSPEPPHEGATDTAQPASNRVNQHIHKCEEQLIQAIIRHGEKIICDTEDENGNTRPLSMVEFIAESLEQDKLRLSDTLYQSILNEALDRVSDSQWKAERHFLQNPDQNISRIAIELAEESETLSKIYGETEYTEQNGVQLLDLAVHLLSDLKLKIIQQEKAELEAALHDPAQLSDKSKIIQLMERYKNIKDIEKDLAKQCGDRVITL